MSSTAITTTPSTTASTALLTTTETTISTQPPTTGTAATTATSTTIEITTHPTTTTTTTTAPSTTTETTISQPPTTSTSTTTEITTTHPTTTTTTTTGPSTTTETTTSEPPSSTATSTSTEITTHPTTTTETTGLPSTTETTTSTQPPTTSTIATTATSATSAIATTHPTTTSTSTTTPLTTTEKTTTYQQPTTTATSTKTETTTVQPPTTTLCPGGHDVTCGWSEWINLGKPTPGPDGGEDESIQRIISAGYPVCSAPEEVQCRAALYPGLSMSQVGQVVTCSKDFGLVCINKQQGFQQECFDYEIKFKCCGCPTPSTTASKALLTTTETTSSTQPPTTSTTATTATSTIIEITTTHPTTTTTTTTAPSTTTGTTTSQPPSSTAISTSTEIKTHPTTTTETTGLPSTTETTTSTQPPTISTTATTATSTTIEIITTTTTTTTAPSTTTETTSQPPTTSTSTTTEITTTHPTTTTTTTTTGPSTTTETTTETTTSTQPPTTSSTATTATSTTSEITTTHPTTTRTTTTTPLTTTGTTTSQPPITSTSTTTEITTTHPTTTTTTTTTTTGPSTTTETTTSEPLSSTATSTSTEITTHPTTTTETTGLPTTTETTTSTQPPTTSTTATTATSTTEWINVGQPTPGPDGGDDESIQRIISAGYPVCSAPEEVQCRAALYPVLLTTTETTTSTQPPTTSTAATTATSATNEIATTHTTTTKWINLGKPTPGPDGGEDESIQRIISAGYPVCSAPEEVQCRAALYPGLSMSQVGQVVSCSKEFGLVCINKQQGFQQECFDYEIKFKCCGCPTPSTAITTTTPSTTASTALPTTTETTTSTQPPTPSTTATTATSTTSEITTTHPTTIRTTTTTPLTTTEKTTTYQQPTTTATSTTTETTTVQPPTTTLCPGGHDVTCGWSEWINLGKPTPGPDGGEDESIQRTISAGYPVCSAPEEVQCRAALYPGLSMSQVGQVVTCSKEFGLVCINKQQGFQQECFDYEIKFKCCGCPTPSTAITTTTPSTTASTALPTTTETTTSTQPPTPSTTATTATSTTSEITTTHPTITTRTTTTTPLTITEKTTTYQQPTTTATSTITETTTSQPLSTTSISTTTETTTVQPPTTTLCPGGHDVTCGWSEWINLGKPTPGPDGGEDESIQRIISAGYPVCSAPEEVQCRAALYPGLSMSQVGQVVTCNKDFGLVCINKQQGFQQECFDYEIKFKCCGCPTPSTAITTTTPSTTASTALPTTTETTTSTQPPTPSTTATTATSTTSEITTTHPTITTRTTTTTPLTTTEKTTTYQQPTTTATSTITETTTSQPLSTTSISTTTETTTVQPPTTTLCPGGHDVTCGWSEWINLGKPTPGPDGGEDESIQRIISAGYPVCSAPEEVQCRAALYPGLSMSQVGQVVTCNKDFGLVCINKQQGFQQECFDYEIKFKCCGCPTPSTAITTITPSTTASTALPTTTETTTSTQPPTTSTTATTATSTTSEITTTHPTTTTRTTTTTPLTTTEKTTTYQQPTATATSTITETTTVQPQTTALCPGGNYLTCGWSEWINVGQPTPGPDGGDDESIQRIISAGYPVCSAPEEVQCRAALYPGLSMSQVGQAVTCNKDFGLICNNKEQGFQQECFDYEIKFNCCVCPMSSTAITTTPSTTASTVLLTTTETTTSTQPPTTSTAATTATSATNEIATTHTTTTSTSTTTPLTTTEKTTTYQQFTTTAPSPITETTTSQPLSTTSISTTTETTTVQPPTTTLCPGGHDVTCGWSEWINLGKPTPGPDGGEDESIQRIISAGYPVCSAPEEVQCRAALYPGLSMSQVGQVVTCSKEFGLVCINKQQGFQQECFDYEIKFKCCGCPTPSTAITTTTPSTTASTALPTTTETTTSTQPPTPSTTATTETSTTSEITTTHPTTISTTTTTPLTTTEKTTTYQQPTTTATSTTTETTTVQPPTTTLCPGGHDVTCGWSEWINLGKPTPGPDGGEDESIQRIISAGYPVCSAPEEVQCRAALYPGLSMSQVGQVVTCSKEFGLVCINKQQGFQQECFDYEIKFKCCGCPTPSTAITMTTPSTTASTALPTTTETTTSTQPPTPSTTATTATSTTSEITTTHPTITTRTTTTTPLTTTEKTTTYQQPTTTATSTITETTTSQPLSTTSISTTTETTTVQPPTTTLCPGGHDVTCGWSEWISLGKPTPGPDGGEDESIQRIISAGYSVCSAPEEVQCRAALYPGLSMSQVGQVVTCNKDFGLVCINKQQGFQQECFDYEIKFKCCGCPTSSTAITTTTPSTTASTALPTTTETTTSTQPPTTSTTATTETSTTSEITTTRPITTTRTTTTTTLTTTEKTTTYQQPTTTASSTTTETTTVQPPTTTLCPGGHDVTCGWSEWINLGKPTPGPDGGEDESIQRIISAGYPVCSAPEEVQCRAALYPGLSMSQVGQVVTCSKEFGLVCINKQQGFQQECFDYEIKFKCCGCPTPSTAITTTTPSTTASTALPTTTETITSTQPPPPSTTATTATSTTSEITTTHPTTTTRTTTTTPLTTTEKTTTYQQPTTTASSTTTETTTVQPPTTTLCPGGHDVTCGWSEWINLGKPTPGPDGGEDESIQRIISAGYPVCSSPEEVQCRAALYPGLSMSQVGQVMTCSKEFGLVCINKQQGFQQECFDYEIKFKCCGCPTPSTAITTTTPSTTASTALPSTTETTTSTQPPTPSTTATTETSTTSEITTTHPTTISTTTTTPLTTTEKTTTYQQPTTTATSTTTETTTVQPPTTTLCPGGQDVTCGWSEWINLGKPTPGPDGGEDESIQRIISAGYPVCSAPEEVQCRAALYPGLSMSQVGQVVTCSKEFGLVCINKQQGFQQECFDYEIKFKCCGCPTPSTAITTTTPSTTASAVLPTTTETTTSTQPPTPSTTATTATSTTSEITTTHPTTTTRTTTTTPLTTTEKTTTYQQPTTTASSTTTETTTAQPPTTTLCPGGHDVTCGWSEWINLGKPTPGPDGGEDESIQRIISAGYPVCSSPEEVQCRAALYPGLSMSQVGQVVTCSKDFGLVCINKQQGLQQECFDYEIKFKCCGCPTPSTAITMTTPSTTASTALPTTTETTTSTQPPTTTTTTTTTTTAPSTITETTTSQPLPTTSTSTRIETTTVQPPPTTLCPGGHDVTCGWSEWINLGKPTPGPDGGEDESIQGIISAGYPVCSAPEEVQCRAALYPGSIVYNETDHDGYCYIGYCNDSCQVVPKHYQCPTHGKECVNVNPPRQDGESWKVNNCITGTCNNGNVTYNQTHCPTQKPVVCANNFPAIEVPDDDGCCTHYECQCICYGWGDPHYVTFDGTYYGFQGNCSYWLVKEIVPIHNFSVIIDNFYCGAPDGLSCPQSITVFYKNYKIFITQKDINGTFTNQISVNDKPVSPAYQNGDFRITTTGIDTVLIIPAIQAKITFSGLIFSIYLPYSEFANNTEGQCGTCNNNRTEDCRLPSGTIDPSCSNMAHQWNTNNSHCEYPIQPLPTPAPNNCSVTICDIIKSSVFEDCHNIIDYDQFVVACQFDVCHLDIHHIGCTSIEAYADACAEAGVCIDWRNASNGICEYECKSPKVYQSCGPLVEPTCDSWYNEKFIYSVNEFSAMTNGELEGCYCPSGTVLLSSSSSECVPTCGSHQDSCDTQANTTWTEGCEECICEEDTLQVTCHHVSCPTQPPLSCDQEGQVKITDTVGCCQQEKCECDVKQCSGLVPSCPVGFTLNTTMGVCCLKYGCVPKSDVCVFNNHEYQVGDLVPMKSCAKCSCSNQTDTGSHLHTVECHPIPCDIHCPLGYEYQNISNQCCGKCVQTSCIVTLSNNSTYTLKPGAIWTPAGNTCVKFECVQVENQFITIEAKTICPPYDPNQCIPGTETIAPDGCCNVCILKGQPCNVSTTTMYLESQGCQSKDKINVTSCSGACGTFTYYSNKMRSLQHTCSCCQELATSERQIQLSCPDNTEITYTYTHIDDCGCLKTECSALGHSEMVTTPSRKVKEELQRTENNSVFEQVSQPDEWCAPMVPILKKDTSKAKMWT
ncbi:mucin-5AC-like [Chaetodon trifascialis]|uniref:mucin-5AC-like n=1 Tax=Chaetodon trifascialis TaxID=109706 RepID=UPI003994BD2E